MVMRLLSRYKWLPSWEPRPPAVDLVARAPTDGSARSTATKADPALLGVIPCFPACAPRALPPASFLARAARKTCPAVSKTQLVARCRLPLRRLLQLRRQDLLEVAAGAERRLWWWWLVVVVAIASCMTVAAEAQSTQSFGSTGFNLTVFCVPRGPRQDR